MKITIVETRANSQQSLWLTAYAENNGTPWRARIKRNFYDFQSYAIAERWDGSKWHEAFRVMDVSTLRIQSYPTHAHVARWEADARQDALDLLNIATAAVGEPVTSCVAKA